MKRCVWRQKENWECRGETRDFKCRYYNIWSFSVIGDSVTDRV